MNKLENRVEKGTNKYAITNLQRKPHLPHPGAANADQNGLYLFESGGRGYHTQKIKTMNNYNPKIHHRRSIRLRGYDY